mgnify:CR=1 FL=1
MSDKEKEQLRREKARQYYKKNKERIKQKKLAVYYNKKYENGLKKPSDKITVVYDDVTCEI